MDLHEQITALARSLAGRLTHNPRDRARTEADLVHLIELVCRAEHEDGPVPFLASPPLRPVPGPCTGQCCGGSGPYDAEHCPDWGPVSPPGSVFGPVRSGLVPVPPTGL